MAGASSLAVVLQAGLFCRWEAASLCFTCHGPAALALLRGRGERRERGAVMGSAGSPGGETGRPAPQPSEGMKIGHRQPGEAWGSRKGEEAQTPTSPGM